MQSHLSVLALVSEVILLGVRVVLDTLAVVGATGAVGQIILKLLEQRQFPAKNFKLLASARSAGKEITLNGKKHIVEELTPDSFKGVQVAIGSTPDETARDFVPWAVERGCIVVDESGYFRMNPEVPLVIPEVNPQDVKNTKGSSAAPIARQHKWWLLLSHYTMPPVSNA